MAIDNNIVGHAEIAYLGDPFEQYAGINGKPLVGGHIEVYLAGTDTKYITFENFDGAQNPFKVPINNDGRVVMLADPSLTYDIYIYDSFNNLASSRVNVQCNVPGTINLSGADTRIKNTDGTLDITLETSADNVRVYNIDTHHKELGVEEPLYFVQDDASATIIGIQESGYVNPSALSAYMPYSAIGYDENGRISGYDGSALAGNYEAGSYIDIDNYVISVTGLQPSGDYASASDISAINEKINELSADASGYAKESAFELDYKNEITAYNGTAFAGEDITGIGLSAGNGIGINVSDDTVTISVTGDYVEHDELSAYATTALVSSVSSILHDEISSTSGINVVYHDDHFLGDGTSGDPLRLDSPISFSSNISIGSYGPNGSTVTDIDSHDHTYIGSDGITLSQDGQTATINASGYNNKVDTSALSGYLVESSFDYDSNNKISGYNGSAFATDDITGINLSAGTGIDITVDDDTVTISVTAQGGNPEVDNLVTAQSATWNSVTGKADTTALTAYQPVSSMNNYATTALVSSVSSELYSAFSSISGEYELIAGSGIELTDDSVLKTTTITVTAKGGDAEVESLVHSQSATWNTVTGKQDAGNYYSASNPSGFITAGGELTLVAGSGINITETGTSAIIECTAQGSEIPTAVSSYWQDASDAVNTNSATWNTVTGKQDAGDYYSASNPSGFITAAGELTLSGVGGITVSETGTTALIELANTDLFVQAPLFSGMSGTSAYIGCNFNETVLWSGSQAWSANSTATLSEPLSSFDKVQFVIQPFPTKACEILNYEVSSLEYDISVIGFNGTSGLRFSRVRLNSTDNYTKLAYSDSIELTFGNTAFSWNASNAKTMKIIGVNRKA